MDSHTLAKIRLFEVSLTYGYHGIALIAIYENYLLPGTQLLVSWTHGTKTGFVSIYFQALRSSMYKIFV